LRGRRESVIRITKSIRRLFPEGEIMWCKGQEVMFNYDPKRPLVRGVAAIAGLVVIGWGVAAVRPRGDLHYSNWFGEPVFAPFAIIFGLIIVVGALFKPEILGRSHSRLRK
jgi:hypothetical protein